MLLGESQATDGKEHEVVVYFDASAEIAVNDSDPESRLQCSQGDIGDLAVVKIGSEEQPILAKKGDDLRIDWGYLYMAATARRQPTFGTHARQDQRESNFGTRLRSGC